MGRTIAFLLTIFSCSAAVEPPKKASRVHVCGPLIKKRTQGEAIILYERKPSAPPSSIVRAPKRFRSSLIDRD